MNYDKNDAREDLVVPAGDHEDQKNGYIGVQYNCEKKI